MHVISRQNSHEMDNRSKIMEKVARCLVGEVLAGTPTLATIIQELPINDVPPGQPQCFRLDSGELLLRRLPKPLYRELLGTTQIIMDEAQIRWRCPLATDGAFMVRKETITLEVRGVLFGLRSKIHTTNLVRGSGSLQSIINNGLQQGDPNVMHIEVTVFGDTNVLQSVAVDSAPGGPLAVLLVILGAFPKPGQTAASATPGPLASPKASKGKATTQFPMPALMAASSLTSAGELQSACKGHTQPRG